MLEPLAGNFMARAAVFFYSMHHLKIMNLNSAVGIGKLGLKS
jgi:hypothetical protein